MLIESLTTIQCEILVIHSWWQQKKTIVPIRLASSVFEGPSNLSWREVYKKNLELNIHLSTIFFHVGCWFSFLIFQSAQFTYCELQNSDYLLECVFPWNRASCSSGHFYHHVIFELLIVYWFNFTDHRNISRRPRRTCLPPESFEGVNLKLAWKAPIFTSTLLKKKERIKDLLQIPSLEQKVGYTAQSSVPYIKCIRSWSY